MSKVFGQRRGFLIGIVVALVVLGILGSLVLSMTGRSLPAYAPLVQPEQEAQRYAGEANMAYALATAAPIMDGLVQPGEQPVDDQPIVAGQDRLIIRNGNVQITVDDIPTKLAQITALAGEYGGWVVTSNSSTNGGNEPRVTNGTITIRVLAQHFDAALGRIKTDVHEVNSEAVSGQDVTQDYVDAVSRVANLEAAERQLQVILEDARRTEDVLQVFNELTRIRGEIESLRGQILYYEEASAYSAIVVTLYATPITPPVEPVEVTGWQPLAIARDAAQALVNVLQGLANGLIVVLVFVMPLALLVGVPVWVARRIARRRRVASAAG
jgi:hypothetical protein